MQKAVLSIFIFLFVYGCENSGTGQFQKEEELKPIKPPITYEEAMTSGQHFTTYVH